MVNIIFHGFQKNQCFQGKLRNKNRMKADKLIYSIFITRWERISTYTAVWLDGLATNITIYQATNSKQGILKIRIVYKN